MNRLVILAALVLGGCGGTSIGDGGCVTYGTQRALLPPLGDDPVSQWVDVTDGAMTAACT